MPRTRVSLLLGLALLFVTNAIHAQSTSADIGTRLKGKSLYLRGGWTQDKLHFESTGHLTGSSPEASFTLSGFELRKLSLNKNRLKLQGKVYQVLMALLLS